MFSCDQVIFEISLYVPFQYIDFAKLEAEFTEITPSREIDEII